MQEKYETLDAKKIIETLETLCLRVKERFPESGLAEVSKRLLSIGRQHNKRSKEIKKPSYSLRILTSILILALIATLVFIANYVFQHSSTTNELTPDKIVSFIHNFINNIVFFGLVILFIINLENKIKRGRALKAMNELRSIAHIIDMHQLTKDPDPFLIAQGKKTPSSPARNLNAFDLSRYFDYCSELLSLTGKIAALYIQKYNDPVVLSAVNEIESLTSGLSRKIWQKVMILHSAMSTVRLHALLKKSDS